MYNVKSFAKGYEVTNAVLDGISCGAKALRVGDAANVVTSFFAGMNLAIQERRGKAPRILVLRAERLGTSP